MVWGPSITYNSLSCKTKGWFALFNIFINFPSLIIFSVKNFIQICHCTSVICSVIIKSIWIIQLSHSLPLVKVVPTNWKLFSRLCVLLETLHLMKWRLSLSASLRLSTSCGLFVSPGYHRLKMTSTTNSLLMDGPDGPSGTSLRESRASWQIKISSNWFPAESWKSETYISLVSSDTQTLFLLLCTAKENTY